MLGKWSEKKPDRPLFIRKSSGIGWGLNPHHPAAWIIMLGLLIIIVFTLFTH